MSAGRAVGVSPLVSLLKRENLGAPHAVFAGGERYFSHRFAAEAERVLEQELAGVEYRETVDLVRVVQQATAEFYGWVTGVAGDYAVLVASHGRQAVCLVRHGDSVRFERCDTGRMANTLVARLPEVAVGRGEPISVRHADFHSRARGSLLRRPTPASPAGARRLDALLDARRLHVAKVYAARRDDAGNRQRSPQWVTVLDLVDGRWALTVNRAHQQDWIDARPGTPTHLAETLAELARSIR